MTRITTLLLIASALLLAACGASFQAANPSGFVQLEEEDSEYAYRAITAEGELAFWVRAIENQLRQRGYALLETRDVSCRTGQQGQQLRFGHDEGRQPHLYYVSVFLTDSYIYVLEAGGTKKLMLHHEKQLDWAVTNFAIK
jgi:hypothetical protein